MPHCDPTPEQLLDFVYGLLEADEIPALQEHLSGCPACQAALEQARGQQKLMARAAQAIRAEQVPVFHAPGESAPLPATLPLHPVVMPVETPAAEAPPARRRFLRPARLAWAAAAAVLLAVGVSWFSYQRGLNGYEDSLAQSRKRVQEIEAQLASLKPSFDREQKSIVETSKAEHLHLQVMGAQRIHPVAGGVVHVALRDLEGKPASGKLQYELRRPADGQTLRSGAMQAQGDVQLVLPAVPELAGQSVHFVLEAETGRASAKVQETLAAPASSFVTHLSTSKATYRPGDALFFRALALDGYSLTPPSTPLPLRVELVDPSGKAIETLNAVTGSGGVVAGAFAVAQAWPEGNYTLRVQAGSDAKSVVQGHAQRLAFVRDTTPDIEFDRDEYRGGDGVVVTMRSLMSGVDGTKGDAAKSSVPDRVLVNGQSVPTQKLDALAASGPGGVPPYPGVGGFGGGGFTGGFGGGAGAPGGKGGGNLGGGPAYAASGGKDALRENQSLQAFRFMLPASLPSNKARIEIPRGDGKASIVRDVPLVPAKLTVDFFPEGGDLVAGVPNRVYFRVRALDGSLASPEGHVIVLSKDSVIYDSERQQSLGSFDFTPSANDVYTVRLTSPLGVAEIAQPFEKSPLLREGITMRVANSVAREGEPIHVVFHQQGANRRLFVTAHCRGQLVAQHWIDVQKSEQTLAVTPTLNARGVLRITAHEAVEGKLIPVAERLVFRSAEPLSLSITGDKAGLSAKTGASLAWTVESRDARQMPADAWVQAAVVAERFRGREHSLAAHFQLFGEVRGLEDLDNAVLLVNDTPEAWHVLDRFLGTYGWRRFAREEVTLLAQLPQQNALLDATNAEGAYGGGRGTASTAPAPLLFSRENESLARQRDHYEAQVEKSLAPVRVQSAQKHSELSQEKASALQTISGLVRAVEDQRQRPREWLQIGFGVLFVVLLVVSVVMMGVAVYRLARSRQATGAFGGAFAGMLASLLIVLLSSSLGEIGTQHVPGRADAPQAAAWPRDLDSFLRQIGNLPQLGRPASAPAQTGYFALAVQPKEDTARRDQETRMTGDSADQKSKGKNDPQMGGVANSVQIARAQPTAAAVTLLLVRDRQRSKNEAEQQVKMQGAASAPAGGNEKATGSGPSSPVQPTAPPSDPKSGLKSPTPSLPGAGQVVPPPAPLPQPEKKGEESKKESGEKKDGNDAKGDVRRMYAYRHAPGIDSDTLLWQPSLATVDGAGLLRFDAASPGSYRVLLWAHTPDGRFGFYVNRLEVGR